MAFNPSRLTLARQRRGMTKTDLAGAISLTVRSVSAYEAGDMEPSEATVAQLAQALRFPRAFFSGVDLDVPRAEAASFRALSSMSAGQRDSALGAGALAMRLAEWLGERFNLPEANLPDLRGEAPEAAANLVRESWNLGDRPIKNVVHLLEARGVRVFSLVQECNAVDAFSVWRGKTPFVFLNTIKSAERGRFDGAHELGHLVLHRNEPHGGRDAERDADAFASAFLMPKASVVAKAPPHATIDRIIKLKKNWNVSVAALAYRLHFLGLMSDWHYRTICIEIAQRGFRSKEPEPIPRETSQLLQKVLQALREDGVSKFAVAEELELEPGELDALMFGLVMTPVTGGSGGGGIGTGRGRAGLRLL